MGSCMRGLKQLWSKEWMKEISFWRLGEYEESHNVFGVEEGVFIQERLKVMIENICVAVVEEGIVEDGGIKYETQLLRQDDLSQLYSNQ